MIRRRVPAGGFTLVELMVVVLVIALLITIAIPVFLGARRRAQDRAAQSVARQTLTAARIVFEADENYLDVTITKLADAETSATYVPGTSASTASNVASVDTPDPLTLIVAVYSPTGTCWFLKDQAASAAGGTRYAHVDGPSAACRAGAPPADGSFASTW